MTNKKNSVSSIPIAAEATCFLSHTNQRLVVSFGSEIVLLFNYSPLWFAFCD